ncbi:MAG: 2-oxoacid ferredoxin oxidoreductase [Elusimicrobia bacterium]|nr:2-oxoacid ferredoxin oxidoreductase [Elusimicrobiota bacterium]MBD3411669.1 2-oxoacid ferredoxin oxidoreductase [Elusimicrobiota bacterium]
MEAKHFASNDEIAWCPGCGNFGILNALKKALASMGKKPNELLIVSGIGQAAKLPHYLKANCFNGLHGRALPVAQAAKMANPKLTVLVTTGDGDCYGEGGNHFIHAVRRNVDITVIVHNNQIYGLTKGQASPTTDPGYVTKVQTEGVMLEPFHALSMAIVLGAGFVARGFSRNSDELAELIQRGINHKGFSLVEVLQPCVSFNTKNTYQWYNQRMYRIDQQKDYDNHDMNNAIIKGMEWNDRIPVGVIYEKQTESFGDKAGINSNPPGMKSAETIDDLLAVYS